MSEQMWAIIAGVSLAAALIVIQMGLDGLRWRRLWSRITAKDGVL